MNKRSNNSFFFRLVFLAGMSVCLVFGSIMVWRFIRPQPRPMQQTLFEGIEYQRLARSNPRQQVIHVVTVDLRTPGLRFLVTPGDAEQELPLQARTTGEFLTDFDLQLAINGDGFEPWESAGFVYSYPKTGDRVAPLGFAASQGEVYAELRGDLPVLYIAPTNRMRFNTPVGRIHNALSGTQMLVERGQASPGMDGSPEPRTAIGLDRQEKFFIIVVVDGRQPGYSEGASLDELASILIEAGAFTAMNLDGGGSSTLVKAGPAGMSVVLNSPVDQNIPGKQRPVGNHLGIYAPALK